MTRLALVKSLVQKLNGLLLGGARKAHFNVLFPSLAQQGTGEAARTQEQMALLPLLGRVGRAEEVADTVAYLLSDAARCTAQARRSRVRDDTIRSILFGEGLLS